MSYFIKDSNQVRKKVVPKTSDLNFIDIFSVGQGSYRWS